MARLPEGMKMESKAYGWSSATYIYKGVKVSKYRDEWCFRVEYQSLNTGEIHVKDTYGSYRLADVPREIEKYLEDGDYYLDTNCGVFRLTEASKAELSQLARVRVAEEIQAMEKMIAIQLENKNWSELARWAGKIAQFIENNKWATEEKAVA